MPSEFAWLRSFINDIEYFIITELRNVVMQVHWCGCLAR